MNLQSLALRLPLISQLYCRFTLPRIPKEEKLPSYKDVEVVANVYVNYDPILNKHSFPAGIIQRLTGIYPLVRSRDGRYFIAKDLQVEPRRKLIEGHLGETTENIWYAMGKRRVRLPILDLLERVKGWEEYDSRELTHAHLEEDKELGIQSGQIVNFL